MKNILSKTPRNSSTQSQNSKTKLIHSNQDKKKYQTGLSRVRNKQALLNYLYNTPLPSQSRQSQQGPDLWADTSLVNKNNGKKDVGQKKGAKLNFFDIALTKYITRKSRRSQRLAIPDSNWERRTSMKSLKRMQPNALVELRKKSKSTLKDRSETNPEKDNLCLANFDLANLYNKNLYQMTKEQLQESIQWKRKFLDLMQTKDIKNKNRETAQRTTISFNSIRRS